MYFMLLAGHLQLNILGVPCIPNVTMSYAFQVFVLRLLWQFIASSVGTSIHSKMPYLVQSIGSGPLKLTIVSGGILEHRLNIFDSSFDHR